MIDDGGRDSRYTRVHLCFESEAFWMVQWDGATHVRLRPSDSVHDSTQHDSYNTMCTVRIHDAMSKHYRFANHVNAPAAYASIPTLMVGIITG